MNSRGERFVDESVSYHRFVRAMYATDSVPAWLVVDSRTLAKYGLGMVTMPHLPRWALKRHRDSGYLLEGSTLEELASRIGVDAARLAETVARFNDGAARGRDDEFHKGETLFGQAAGDPEHRPNPNLGPVEKAPFCAIQVVPTPLATAFGLTVDQRARVLDEAGAPIPGLFAAGNDAQSPFASEYPGAGAQVGGGMTFGWLAARTAAGLDDAAPADGDGS